MKKLFLGGAIVALAALAYAFILVPDNQAITSAPADEIKWYTWDEAIKLSEKKPKKIFVDLYTDWCGWCKKMDKTTFTDPEVAKYMNANFYAVKFNAEQKEDVVYNKHTFKYIASGARGVHELAYSLLDGRLGYPSYVYLDEKQARISISPGYKTADSFIKELKFFGDNHYQKTTYEAYVKSQK
ncbi:MAG: thioredoxin family protein [Saprospiraceae bacterium]